MDLGVEGDEGQPVGSQVVGEQWDRFRVLRPSSGLRKTKAVSDVSRVTVGAPVLVGFGSAATRV